MSLLALAAAMTLAADTPAAAPASSAPATKARPSGEDPDRVVCRTQPVTGSRFNKKVCLTQAQWDEQAKASEDATNRIREHTGLGMAAGGGFSGH